MLWRQVRAKVLARRGEHAEAERLAREAVAIGDETDMLDAQGDAYADLAEVLLLAGKRDEAAAALEQALERYERKGNVVMAARTRDRLVGVAGAALKRPLAGSCEDLLREILNARLPLLLRQGLDARPEVVIQLAARNGSQRDLLDAHVLVSHELCEDSARVRLRQVPGRMRSSDPYANVPVLRRLLEHLSRLLAFDHARERGGLRGQARDPCGQ